MYQYHRVDPPEGRYGVNIGKNVWHTIEALESSVIFECKEVPFVEHGKFTVKAVSQHS